MADYYTTPRSLPTSLMKKRPRVSPHQDPDLHNRPLDLTIKPANPSDGPPRIIPFSSSSLVGDLKDTVFEACV